MVVMMLPVLSILPVDNTKAENVKTESAPMPTWNVGDMWNYSVSMFSGDVTGGFNASIVAMETITTDTNYDVYNTTTHFEYSGTVEGISFSGTMDSIIYSDTSTTAIVKEIATVNVDYGIYGTYYNHTVTTYTPPKDANQFPIIVGEEWNVNVNAHMEWHATEGDGESDPAIVENYVCLRIDAVCVAAGTYNVFVINSTTEEGNRTGYYSPDVGNTVKEEYYNETGALTGEMDLVSYCIGATPTRSVSGTVKDGDDNPVTGATVTVRYTSNNTIAVTALTNTTGEYTISDLPADTYNVSASKSGYTSSYQIVDLTASSASNVDFTLNATPSAGTITGHVYVSGTTTPIPNTNVSINAAIYASCAITDVNGAYTLSGVAQGTHTVTASAAGYTSSFESVTVSAGEVKTQDFYLTPLSETDLVACWHFDENTGTTVYDSSSNNNDGTIYGATWTTGISGSALSFDGTDDYVEVTDDPSLNPVNMITIEAWVKTIDTGLHKGIAVKGWGTGGNEGYVLEIHNSLAAFDVNSWAGGGWYMEQLMFQMVTGII